MDKTMNDVFSSVSINPGCLGETMETEKISQSCDVAEDYRKERNKWAHGMSDKLIIKGSRQIYELLDLNGRGKQAIVYNCVGKSDGRKYVAKLYRKDVYAGKSIEDILEFIMKNRSPYIEMVVEHGSCTQDDVEYFYAIEDELKPLKRQCYVWNGTDDKEYQRNIFRFVEHMNEALGYIHSKGCYHGDVKPDNIMRDAEYDIAVLVDFGGGVMLKNHSAPVKAAALTPLYLAPEALRSCGRINEYSDYYSLGATLAELFVGVYPGDKSEVEKRYEETYSIGYYHLPASLPKHYIKLLEGLLYESTDTYDIREHRFTTDKVREWLDEMKQMSTR